MKLKNSFEIPLAPPEAWEVLLDIERIAPCLPGAEITEVIDEKTYKGRVSLRLGPVALSFDGKVTFEDINHDTRRARVKAQGMDTKGRGGANAEVEFLVEATETGSRIEIETDLNLSGSIAQYGRGVGIIEDVSKQLIGEFATALSKQLSETAAPGSAAETPAAAKPISGLTLMFRVLWNALKRMFSGQG